MADNAAIGFIGTGIMGGHMARRLAQAGHFVTAWNRTASKAEALVEHGVKVAQSAAVAASRADVVIVMVSDGPTSDAVILGEGGQGGVLEVMQKNATLLVMSSIPVATAKAQAEAAAARSIEYIDAPVSGGEPGARDGKMAIMAGGNQAAFDSLRPVFEVMGRATLVGPSGAGSLAKLANQVIVGNTIQTVAEALLLAQAGGADPVAVIKALKGGFADSPILQNHGRRMIEGNFTPGARSIIQLKDTRTAEELGSQFNVVMPMTSQARKTFSALVDNGQGDLDHNAAWLHIRKLSGMDK